MQKPIISLFLGVNLWLASFSVHAQPPTPMPLQANQPAPNFQTEDVYGKPVSLSALRGQFVLLSFMRNAGCPVCNFHVHELLKKADSLRAANVAVVLVYESTKATMVEYLQQADSMPFSFVADPQKQLYSRYQVGRDMGKMMSGMFHGAMRKMTAGKKLFRKSIKQDGDAMRIGADFLIDPQGRLHTVHYGRYLGDHLTVAQLVQQTQAATVNP
jgi:thioredoxin-dependent peroxiredoxin